MLTCRPASGAPLTRTSVAMPLACLPVTSVVNAPANPLRSRWQNTAIFAGMVMFLVAGVGFSVLLAPEIADMLWRSVAKKLGVALSALVFGTLAIRAWRIGLYANYPGKLTVRSLTITRTLPLEAVERIGVYHGHSSHGGRFFAPGIYVRSDGDEPRLVRLWWLAAVTEKRASCGNPRSRH